MDEPELLTQFEMMHFYENINFLKMWALIDVFRVKRTLMFFAVPVCNKSKEWQLWFWCFTSAEWAKLCGIFSEWQPLSSRHNWQSYAASCRSGETGLDAVSRWFLYAIKIDSHYIRMFTKCCVSHPSLLLGNKKVMYRKQSSRVVRIDPLYFLARCTLRLYQALSVLSLSLDFFSVSAVLLTMAPFCVVLLMCSVFWLFLLSCHYQCQWSTVKTSLQNGL